ncbi:MAG: hypothetical protein WCT28_01970 [Patescibacteria group bacterium]|jgi:hypothetical protein
MTPEEKNAAIQREMDHFYAEFEKLEERTRQLSLAVSRQVQQTQVQQTKKDLYVR